jgi:hypothetical protein
MKKLLVILAFGLRLRAGTILEASGEGELYYGYAMSGQPMFDIAIAGVDCQPFDGVICWSQEGTMIDGVYFDSFRMSLEGVAGMQTFDIYGTVNGTTYTQQYETFGTITSDTLLAPGLWQENFTFSADAETPEFIFPMAQTNSVARVTPEPLTIWLALIGLIALVALKLAKRRRMGLRGVKIGDQVQCLNTRTGSTSQHCVQAVTPKLVGLDWVGDGSILLWFSRDDGAEVAGGWLDTQITGLAGITESQS